MQDIEWFLKDVKRGDVVLFLGAGDIYYIAKSIIKKYE
jgi:UDP-N-acetylmuramate-alanine ligase